MKESVVVLWLWLLFSSHESVTGQACENNIIFKCATVENKLDRIADHIDIYKCIMNYLGKTAIPLSDWCRAQERGIVCVEEELQRSIDAADHTKSLALQGILKFYNFTCRFGGTNDYEIHRICVYQDTHATSDPKKVVETCMNIYWNKINTMNGIDLCPNMINLLRCVSLIRPTCGMQGLYWMRRSLFNFLSPTADSVQCEELEGHTVVGNDFDQTCNDKSLSHCLIPELFLYSQEKPVFPDMKALELALKPRDLEPWCKNKQNAVGCLYEKKEVCDKYDLAEIEGTVSMLQHVCNEKTLAATSEYKTCLYQDHPDLEQQFRNCEEEAAKSMREDPDLSAEDVCNLRDDTLLCKRDFAKKLCGDAAAEWQYVVETKLTTNFYNLVFKCHEYGGGVPFYAIITTAVIAGMLLVVIIIVCVCCCACLDNKGINSKPDLPKQDMMAPNAYTLLMNSKPHAHLSRDSDAHAYDNVMDAIDAETLERKTRRAYPVVTPVGSVKDDASRDEDTIRTSEVEVHEPRRSTDSDPYAASFLPEAGGPGGVLVSKSSTATAQSSNLAGSSINRDSYSKDSEATYPSLGRTDSSAYKDSLGEESRTTASNASTVLAFGAVNPAYRQSLRESDNTDESKNDYQGGSDTGARSRETASIFATNASAESPSLGGLETPLGSRVSVLRDSFNEKIRQQQEAGKRQSTTSNDYYPLLRQRSRSPTRAHSPANDGEANRKISAETYMEQAADTRRESYTSTTNGRPSGFSSFNAEGWDEFERDLNRKVSQSTTLKPIAENSRPPSINPPSPSHVPGKAFLGRSVTGSDGSNTSGSVSIDKHVRDAYLPRDSSPAPTPNQAPEEYEFGSVFRRVGSVPSAPPPPAGRTVPFAPTLSIPNAPPPPPL